LPAVQVLWVIALSCVLAYTGYQTYECYLSYTNPGWYVYVYAPHVRSHRLRSARIARSLIRRAPHAMPRNRTTGVEFKSQLDFPVVLVCPVFPAKRDLYDTNGTPT
jgi:hypothetical protein